MNGKKLTCSLAAVMLAAFGLGGCGGGTTTGTSALLEGTAVKGPVNGATITAFGIRNGTMGELLGSATTGAQGDFSMTLSEYSGPVMLQMSGGAYIDEATGNSMPMAAGNVMTAIIPMVFPDETISDIAITPLTSMAQAMAHNMAGGMNAANISAANAWVSDAYMVGDILTTQPMNPLVPGSGTYASQAGRNYGMVLASMSQYAMDMGMASSSAIVTAMMDDAADGVMDGMMGNSGIVMGGMGNGVAGGGDTTLAAAAGTSGLADAMNTFVTTSPMNRSGLMTADMQTLMNQLHVSSGWLATDDALMSGSGMVSGTAFNGTVQGATVAAYSIINGAVGGQLAGGTTDPEGNFSLGLGSYEGPVMLRMSGGTYTDLATAATMTMPADTVMTALMPSLEAGGATGIEITPLTSMAQERVRNMAGGMTAGNITAANMAIGDYFMVDDILTTPPTDPLRPGSGIDATQNSLHYGMTIAAMSQYAENIGLTDPAEIITVMMRDAADGVMNGMRDGAGISMEGMDGGMMNGGANAWMQAAAGTSGLAEAMRDFMDSAFNMSGVTAADMQILIDHLHASNGTLP